MPTPFWESAFFILATQRQTLSTTPYLPRPNPFVQELQRVHRYPINAQFPVQVIARTQPRRAHQS